MRVAAIACAALILCGLTWPGQQNRAVPQPSQFVIGEYVYFDFGPPFGFYELYVVRATARGSSLERISLTPPGDKCAAPAKLDVAAAKLKDSVPELLGPTNPCAIPERDLRRKPRRCKNCMVFSGADVLMQVQCGAETRTIRSDILDRDMYGPAANVPRNISWTMQLLKRLESAVGPGPEKTRPIFALSAKEQAPAKHLHSPLLQQLAAGRYDALFSGDPFKPSNLYQATQNPPPPPTVRLVSSKPVAPMAPAMPVYPPIAVLAHIEGSVTFNVEIGPDGRVADIVFVNGSPLLRGVVKEAVDKWRFPKGSANRQSQATISFVLKCLH